jgi:hypothetical protein
MQEGIQKYVLSSKSKSLLIATVAGLLGTLAFDAVMYIDIAITGIPFDVAKVLGGLLVGQNGPIDLVGHTFHFLNGIGLALFYDLIFLRVSTKVLRSHMWLHGIVFAMLVTVMPLWLGLLPVLGAGIAGANISPLVSVITIVRHIAFGIVLGLMVKGSN